MMMMMMMKSKEQLNSKNNNKQSRNRVNEIQDLLNLDDLLANRLFSCILVVVVLEMSSWMKWIDEWVMANCIIYEHTCKSSSNASKSTSIAIRFPLFFSQLFLLLLLLLLLLILLLLCSWWFWIFENCTECCLFFFYLKFKNEKLSFVKQKSLFFDLLSMCHFLLIHFS